MRARRSLLYMRSCLDTSIEGQSLRITGVINFSSLNVIILEMTFTELNPGFGLVEGL